MDNQYLTLASVEAFDPTHRRTGGDFTHSCCPLCGDAKPRDKAHRSFSYSENTGAYRCYRCSATGTLKEFWKPLERDSFTRSPFQSKGGRFSSRGRAESLRARFAGTPIAQPVPMPSTTPPVPPIAIPSVKQAVPAPSLREKVAKALGAAKLSPATEKQSSVYLSSRGLDPVFCQDAGVRFARSFYGGPAIAFAVRGAEGELVALQGRYIDGREDPRMRTAGNRGSGVFSTPGALHKETIPVFVEAPIDALSLAMAGTPAIALCGSDGIPDWLLRRLAFRADVIAAFDADEAGDKAAVKLATALARYGATVKRLRPVTGKDWNEVLKREGLAELQRQTSVLRSQIEASPEPETVSDDFLPGLLETPTVDKLGSSVLYSTFPDDEPGTSEYTQELLMLGQEADELIREREALFTGPGHPDVQVWKEGVTDEEYISIVRDLRSMAFGNRLPVLISPLCISQGESVADPNRFVMLACDRVEAIVSQIKEGVTKSNYNRLCTVLQSISDRLDAVAIWYAEQERGELFCAE